MVENGYAVMSDWFFQVVFVAIAASVASGTVADKPNFSPRARLHARPAGTKWEKAILGLGFYETLFIGLLQFGVGGRCGWFGATVVVVGAVSAHCLGGGPLVDIGLAFHLPHAVAAFVPALAAPLLARPSRHATALGAALLWLLGGCWTFPAASILRDLAVSASGPVVSLGALMMMAGGGLAGR